MNPKSSHEVLTREGDRLYVKQWVTRHNKVRPARLLMLVGRPGLGKSTLVMLCLKESNYSVISVGADTYKNAKRLAQNIEDAVRLPLKQAVVVEDPQVMAADGGLQVLLRFVKRATRIPIIVVCCQSKKSKVQQLVSHADLVYFESMPTKKLMQHFGVTAAGCFDGDLRQISMHKVHPWGEAPQIRLDLQTAAKRLLEGLTVKEGVRVCSIDRQGLQNVIHANYTDVVKDCSTAASVACDLSDADLLSVPSEDVPDELAGIVGCISPGHRIRKPPRQLRPDLLWTKSSLRQVRVRNLASSQHIFQASGTHLDVYTLPFVRDRMTEAAERGEFESVVDWAPTATLQQLTTVMHLSWSPRTKTIVNRFRRAVRHQPRFVTSRTEKLS